MTFTKKQVFLAEMIIAIKNKKGFVIEVGNPKMPKPEIITNPIENLEYKYEYYNDNYNDELELNADNSISIIRYYTCSNLNNIHKRGYNG